MNKSFPKLIICTISLLFVSHVSGQTASSRPTSTSNTTLPDSVIMFQDPNFKQCCLGAADTNRDGEVSFCEAEKVTRLWCMPSRSNIFMIHSYDELRWFPGLEELTLAPTPLDTLDLRYNTRLKKLDVNVNRKLKAIILADGCQPEITPNYNITYIFWRQEK